MTATALATRPDVEGSDPLLDIILARLAPEGGAKRAEAVRELAPYAPEAAAAAAKARIAAGIDRALRVGMAEETRQRITLTDRGRAHLQGVLAGPIARTWTETRDVRLVALALDLAREPAGRLKLLARPDGLRAQIVNRAFGLKLKGSLSPSRVRTALAVVALERAFGNKLRSEIGAGKGLPAKASRLLASKLSSRRREFGSDARLIAALAAEALGLKKDSIEDLRTALLRRHAGGAGPLAPSVPGIAPVPAEPPARTPEKAPARPSPPAARQPAAEVSKPAAAPVSPGPSPVPAVPAAQPAVATAAVPTPLPRPAAASRPDLAGFVREVQAAARTRAEGWPGNRKAYVCHVWSEISAGRPEWGLSEIEFKSMLAEAHRTGHLVLANADLKDKRTVREVQASAIAYKNTVWHFVRVED